MDWIHIRGLRCWARVGVGEEERRRRQEVRIDLDLGKDLRKAGRSDRVAETVDYAEVARQVRRLVEAHPFHLAEAMAEGIADQVLQQFNPREIRVSVRKFSVLGTESVGVEITRRRSRKSRRSRTT